MEKKKIVIILLTNGSGLCVMTIVMTVCSTTGKIKTKIILVEAYICCIGETSMRMSQMRCERVKNKNDS